MDILAVDPTTPAEVITTTFSSATTQLLPVIAVAVPAIIGLSAMFWAARLVLRKTGLGKGAQL